MTTLRIAEVAERTGVPATTLRYYEDVGLLAPARRTANGYRAYSHRDVERLLFVAGAKALHLGLDEVRGLVTAWDGDDCRSVRERMAAVVSRRIARIRRETADLAELAARLQAAATGLAAVPPHPGACEPNCTCAAASTASPTAAPAPIACALDESARRARIGDWQAARSGAIARERMPDGWALSFGHDADLTVQLARLAAAEHACCPVLEFTLTVTTAGVRLEVHAPREAQQAVTAMLGLDTERAHGEHARPDHPDDLRQA